MNIKGLEAFSAIMSVGSLSAAAEQLHVSVPALSRRLALFETELGLTLFNREKQRLVPTEEGRAFYSESARLLQSLQQIPSIVEEIQRGIHARLRVVLMPRLSEAIGMPAISQFMTERPDVHVIADLEVWRSIEIKIASRQFDIGLGGLPARHESLETESLGPIPFVAAMNPKHPLATRKMLTVSDLAGEALIVMPNSTWVGRQTNQMFADEGIEPLISAHVSQVLSCCYLAATGGGIAIADALTASMVGPSIKSLPIDTNFGVEIGMIFPRETKRSADTERLADIFREKSRNVLAEVSGKT